MHSAALAVCHGRVVQPGGAGVPARPRRPRHRPDRAVHRQARWRTAGEPVAGREFGRIGSRALSSSTDFLLALESVSVSFDGFKAVNDLNLYGDKNEVRVIIGPNGAGKTTVLDLICGRTKLSSGSIKFKDQEITGLKEHEIVRRGIGRKFQTPSIYEDLTVFEQLEFSLPSRRTVAGALF